MAAHTLSPHDLPTRWQRLALRLLALLGWRVRFAPLPGPRGVVIVYPHTSNWDVVIGLLAKWAIGEPFRWLGKEALFRGLSGVLLAPLLRAWGCEPVERHASTGAIERLAGWIRAADRYWLALAPEGTRKYRNKWRSGFYHIALAARVPLGMACIDYRAREVRLVEYAMLSGDGAADLALVRHAYRDAHGLKPEWASAIDFGAAQAEAPRPQPAPCVAELEQ